MVLFLKFYVRRSHLIFFILFSIIYYSFSPESEVVAPKKSNPSGSSNNNDDNSPTSASTAAAVSAAAAEAVLRHKWPIRPGVHVHVNGLHTLNNSSGDNPAASVEISGFTYGARNSSSVGGGSGSDSASNQDQSQTTEEIDADCNLSSEGGPNNRANGGMSDFLAFRLFFEKIFYQFLQNACFFIASVKRESNNMSDTNRGSAKIKSKKSKSKSHVIN